MCACAGDEIARKVAEVAEAVYVTARTWTNPDNPQPHANMRKLPWLQRLHSDGRATFQGGLSVRPDCIIYSTGYKYTYPWLQKTGLLSTGERLRSLLVSHDLPRTLFHFPICRSLCI